MCFTSDGVQHASYAAALAHIQQAAAQVPPQILWVSQDCHGNPICTPPVQPPPTPPVQPPGLPPSTPPTPPPSTPHVGHRLTRSRSGCSSSTAAAPPSEDSGDDDADDGGDDEEEENKPGLPVALTEAYEDMLHVQIAMEQSLEVRRMCMGDDLSLPPATAAPSSWTQARSCIQNNYIMAAAE